MLTLTLTPSLAEAELISLMSLRVLALWEVVSVNVWITMWPNTWCAGLSQEETRHVSKCFSFPILPNCGQMIGCFSPQPNPETQRV